MLKLKYEKSSVSWIKAMKATSGKKSRQYWSWSNDENEIIFSVHSSCLLNVGVSRANFFQPYLTIEQLPSDPMVIGRSLIKKQALSALLRDEKVTNEDESHVDKNLPEFEGKPTSLMIM